ncbi:MAG TPA: hypothetical protein VF434_05515, partial [Promineifilum sp.]
MYRQNAAGTYCRVLGILCLFSVLTAAFSARASPANQPYVYSGLLMGADSSNWHQFGDSMDVDGDTAVIGAAGWNENGADFQGAAYVFAREQDNWTEQARLLSSQFSNYDDQFGAAVAIDGNTIAVGAPGWTRLVPNHVPYAGAVAIFTASGALWTMQTVLSPEDLVSDSYFGYHIALEGDTLAVALPELSSYANEGVYIYRRLGEKWSLETKLLPPPADSYGFASFVAYRQDILLVGGSGRAYVYVRNGTVWSPSGTLEPAGVPVGHELPCALDYDGQTAVIVSCDSADAEMTSAGTAYVFARDGLNWTQQAALGPGEDYPRSVAIDGDRLVLGAIFDDSLDPAIVETGAAYLYERQGDTWHLSQTFHAPDAQTGDKFG